MKVKKGELASGRFRIPYRIYGEQPQTIVCISGAKQTMAAWRSFVRHFVHDYSVVLFDLPGQGRAIICEGDPAITFEEQQQVLLDIIAHTKRSPQVTLAAASWGTIVAAAVAAAQPQLVDKLILGSFGVSTNQAILTVIQQGQQLYDEGRTDEIAPLMIGTFGQQVPDSQKRQIVEQFSSMSEEDFLSFYAHCSFVKDSDHIERFIDLSKITAKTLIICGAQDLILDHEGIRLASQRIPDCQYQLLPDAGHFLHWEDPSILHLYSDFLSAEASLQI